MSASLSSQLVRRGDRLLTNNRQHIMSGQKGLRKTQGGWHGQTNLRLLWPSTEQNQADGAVDPTAAVIL